MFEEKLVSSSFFKMQINYIRKYGSCGLGSNPNTLTTCLQPSNATFCISENLKQGFSTSVLELEGQKNATTKDIHQNVYPSACNIAFNLFYLN